MTDDALRFLAGSDVHLMFSLPGLETYPEHTGGGIPERVLSLFGKAAALGSAATVGVTVTRRNLHEVYSTIGEAFLAGAGDLLLNRFLPGGRGLAHWRDLALDRDGTRRMLDEAEAALRASGRRGHVGTELPRCGFDRGRLAQLQVGTRCGAAHLFFVVDPSGFVRVCNHSATRLLHWTEMERLWEESHWRRFALHQHGSPTCGVAPRVTSATQVVPRPLGWCPESLAGIRWWARCDLPRGRRRPRQRCRRGSTSPPATGWSARARPLRPGGVVFK